MPLIDPSDGLPPAPAIEPRRMRALLPRGKQRTSRHRRSYSDPVSYSSDLLSYSPLSPSNPEAEMQPPVISSSVLPSMEMPVLADDESDALSSDSIPVPQMALQLSTNMASSSLFKEEEANPIETTLVQTPQEQYQQQEIREKLTPDSEEESKEFSLTSSEIEKSERHVFSCSFRAGPRWCWAIVALLLIAIVVPVTVLITDKNRQVAAGNIDTGNVNNTSEPGTSPTPSGPGFNAEPTAHPNSPVPNGILTFSPVSFPDPEETLAPTKPLVNTGCSDAKGPIAINGAPIEGFLEESISDGLVASRITSFAAGCLPNEPGLWYQVTGGDEVLRANTCESPFDSSTVISVYTGSCRQLSCVATDSGLCGPHSSVSWFATKGIQYYVQVTTSQAPALFALRVTHDNNGECSNAIGPLQEGSDIVGSLRDANSERKLTCSFQDVQHGFVWYTVVGTGGWMVASTCNELTNFEARLDVQVLSDLAVCRISQCPAVRDSNCGGGYQIVWKSQVDVTYFILVFKVINLPEQLFQLTIDEFEPVSNDLCENAIVYAGSMVSGTTLRASHDESQESQIPYNEWGACRFYDGAQPGVWYRATGTGEITLASTCNDQTDFASEISVFTGDCLNIACVETQRQYCGEKASVYWDALEGIDYLILVHGKDYGFGANAGTFGLTVEPFATVENDLCENAIESSVGDTLTGSTFDATHDNAPSCDGVQDEAAGVWFTLIGTGRNLRAATCDAATDFDTKITVYQGSSCGTLQCVVSDDNSCGVQSSVQWTARLDQRYYIFVHGRRETSVGTFKLLIEEFTPTVVNDVCDGALSLLPDSQIITGSTLTATFDNAGICGPVPNSGPGVWYNVTGTGKMLTASLCHDETDYDTAISIYKGQCNELLCVAANGDACGRQSEVSWFTLENEVYYVLVHGFNIRSGNFGLSLTEPPSAVANDYCIDAISVSLGPNPIFGTTIDATNDMAPSCLDLEQTGPGVWYTVRGSGEHIEASTCTEGTTFDTIISVYTGSCGNFTCVRADDNSCGTGSKVIWLSEANEIYYILVHGPDDGDFSLTVDKFFSQQPNDLCNSVLSLPPILADDRVIFGSTIGTSFDNMQPCGATNTGPGVWYIVFVSFTRVCALVCFQFLTSLHLFQGTGERLKADTCHPYTNFDTKISVFTGLDCDTLKCVDGNDDGCGLQSVVSWDTVFGELYWVLIHGWGTNREGNFGLTVSGSDIF